MRPNAFPSRERIKSKKDIDLLFAHSHDRNVEVRSCLVYPLRIVWLKADRPEGSYDGARILISVPKKRLRHAVDRVLTRRRVREAWRRQTERHVLGPIDIAFIFVADKTQKYSRIEGAITKFIAKLQGENKIDPQ